MELPNIETTWKMLSKVQISRITNLRQDYVVERSLKTRSKVNLHRMTFDSTLIDIVLWIWKPFAHKQTAVPKLSYFNKYVYS